MHTDEIVEHLNSVLPIELMAVQQHFIHVLILRAWNAPELAEGIVAIDEIDLPNAMRIVDLLVSLGKPPVLGSHFESQYDQMPSPGNSFEGIISSERSIEAKLTTSLSAARRFFEQNNAPHKFRKLVEEPLSHRSEYENWMKERESAGLPDNEKLVPLSNTQIKQLDIYFAHLVLTINQEMVHSFVHWHGDEKVLADSAWAASGGAMMQATAIVNLLGNRRLAPSPIDSLGRNELLPQNIGSSTDEALVFGRGQALGCQIAAESAYRALCGTEFEAPCKKGVEYFSKMSKWRPGKTLPKISNPCLDFKRVLRKYVWEDYDNSRVTA